MTNFFSDTKKIIDKVENEVNDAVDEAELEWTQEEVEGEEDEDRYVWKIRAKKEEEHLGAAPVEEIPD